VKIQFEIKDCDGKVIETRIFNPNIDVSINGYSLVRDLFRVFDPKKVVIHGKSGITITYTKET
jgi:hypothetical protein